MGQATCQPTLIAPHRRLCFRIAAGAERQNLAPGAARPDGAFVIGLEAAAGDPGFETAMLAAIAGRPRKLLGAGPGQRIVAPPAGDSIRPLVRPALKGNARSTAGAEDGGEDDRDP